MASDGSPSGQQINSVKDSDREVPRAMTRLEKSDSLMQAYLNDRTEWELRRDDMIRDSERKAESDPQAMEKLTRKLAHLNAIEEAKLASKYSDSVVRGYRDMIRDYKGHLDIKSTAERLQDSEDSLRELGLPPGSTTLEVEPSVIGPIDWFEALDAASTREDPSQDQEMIKAEIDAKTQSMLMLENQITNLRAAKGDLAETKKTLDAAVRDREDKVGLLNQAYAASTVSVVKVAVAVANRTGNATTAARGTADTLRSIIDTPYDNGGLENKKLVTDVLGTDSAALNNIGKLMDDVAVADAAVNRASRSLAENMRQYNSAVAVDTRTMVETLQIQLEDVKAELAALQEKLAIASRNS